MKYMIVALVLAGALFTTGCATTQANPNYTEYLAAQRAESAARAQQAAVLVEACKMDANPASCVMGVQLASGQGVASSRIQGPPQEREPFYQRLILASLPFAAQAYQFRESTRANIRISESNNNMMESIITTGFNEMGNLGSIPNYSSGGDLILGDGNTVGDGTIGGDGVIGSGFFGNDNLVGDGNTTGDGNLVGEGVIGDGFFGNDNLVGDGTVGGDGVVGDGFFGSDNLVGTGFIGDENDTRVTSPGPFDIDESDNSDNSDNSVTNPPPAP